MSVKNAKSDARAYGTKLQSIRERYEKWALIMVLIGVVKVLFVESLGGPFAAGGGFSFVSAQ